jgi:colanic acid/amylovoran biosynthesis glycosyltransferase
MAENRLSRLRLLVVGSSWPPQTFLGRLLRGLSAAGIRVRVAFTRWPDQEWFHRAGLRTFKTRDWKGPRLARLAWLAWLSVRALFVAPRAFRVFWRHARAQKSRSAGLRALNRLLPYAGVQCDIIYLPWNSAAIDYLPLFDLGKPVLVSCRGSQVNVAPHNPRRTVRQGLPATFDRATAIHCISDSIEVEATRYGLDVRKSRVIRPGIDPEFFSPAPSPEPSDTIRIITVGSLVWVKGTSFAVEAMRHVLDAGVNATFSIVGDGPERQRVLFAIDDLNLHDHVRLLGRLPPIAVRDELRRSDIFVLPSLSEGFCNAAIEAMGCRLPVVMTNCGGAREGVTDGVEGYIVPVWEPIAMADAIVRLARDPALRARMGRAGRERVLREFTVARHVKQFMELLEELRRWAA